MINKQLLNIVQPHIRWKLSAILFIKQRIYRHKMNLLILYCDRFRYHGLHEKNYSNITWRSSVLIRTSINKLGDFTSSKQSSAIPKNVSSCSTMIVTATAFTNPANSGRDKTTSRNPSRNIPKISKSRPLTINATLLAKENPSIAFEIYIINIWEIICTWIVIFTSFYLQ